MSRIPSFSPRASKSAMMVVCDRIACRRSAIVSEATAVCTESAHTRRPEPVAAFSMLVRRACVEPQRGWGR
eukprot:14799682-Heterocapsa_arctica.AAC.1